jgi:ubiquitin-protein ligase
VEVGSSIFVRCDDTRLDVLKALIIGPEGSPYENGCFEFDIWLPPDYPNTPPKVNLMTTGRGTVRFNPNLYNCGKVCLSLLGTWQGPGWDPVRSTLLQVLISIQSLIMVSDPFFNEPGFQNMLGTVQGTSASGAYNSSVREATLRHAMGMCICTCRLRTFCRLHRSLLSLIGRRLIGLFICFIYRTRRRTGEAERGV